MLLCIVYRHTSASNERVFSTSGIIFAANIDLIILTANMSAFNGITEFWASRIRKI